MSPLFNELRAAGAGDIPLRTLQGVDISVLTLDQAVGLLDLLIRAKSSTRVAIANAHTINTVRGNNEYRKVLSRFLVLNDGIGVDIASFLRYGVKFPANLNGTDFLPAYLESTSEKLKIFMLGAKDKVVERAFAEAKRRFSNHEWVGFSDGYFKIEDESALCDRIRGLEVDLLLVAMGNPMQEFWIDRCARNTNATLCIGVGALFDFLSGEVHRAPGWIRLIKLEWGYRLLQEPGRLWRRYLIGNLTFLWNALLDRS